MWGGKCWGMGRSPPFGKHLWSAKDAPSIWYLVIGAVMGIKKKWNTCSCSQDEGDRNINTVSSELHPDISTLLSEDVCTKIRSQQHGAYKKIWADMCVCLCICVSVYMCMHVCVFVSVCTLCVCRWVCVFVYICVCVTITLCVCFCMCMSRFVLCVCVCVHGLVCVLEQVHLAVGDRQSRTAVIIEISLMV